MVIRKRFSYQAIHDVLSGLLEEDLHAKRIGSLNATLLLACCTAVVWQSAPSAKALLPHEV